MGYAVHGNEECPEKDHGGHVFGDWEALEGDCVRELGNQDADIEECCEVVELVISKVIVWEKTKDGRRCNSIFVHKLYWVIVISTKGIKERKGKERKGKEKWSQLRHTGVEEAEDGKDMTVELAFDAETIHGVNLVIAVDTRHTREGKRDIKGPLICESDDIILLALFDRTRVRVRLLRLEVFRQRHRKRRSWGVDRVARTEAKVRIVDLKAAWLHINTDSFD